MGDSSMAEECLHGLGAERFGSVGRDLLGGAPSVKIPAEYLDDGVVPIQAEH